MKVFLAGKRALIPILLLLVFLPLRAGTRPDSSLIQKAQQLCLRGQTDRARHLLDSVKTSLPLPPALQAVEAYLLVDQGGMANRLRAEQLLTDCRAKLKDDPFYHFTRAELYRAQGFESLARKEYQKTVDLAPRFVPALVALGQSYFKDMLRYYHRYTDTEVPISFRDYAIDDYDQAAGYLRRALQLDPGNEKAAGVLGNLYYEAGEYDRMIRLFREQLRRHPQSKNDYLFMGLACLAKRDYARADSAFHAALRLMEAPEKKVFLNPGLISGKSGKKSAPADSAAAFWQRKDPMYLTPENERLLEHFGRVAYAILRFGVPRLHIAGWQTDRGRTYIRYGKPSFIVEYGKSMETNAVYPPQQIWIYPEFQISFSDEFWNGNFQFTQPPLSTKTRFKERTTIDYNLLAHSLFRTQPSRFDFQLSGGTLAVRYRIYAFRSGAGEELLLAYRLPLEADPDALRQTVVSGWFLQDSSGRQVSVTRDTLLLDYRQKMPLRWRDGFFAALPASPPPGDYRYSFEILNKTTEQDFVDRRGLSVPAAGSGLAMSDLVPARRIEPGSAAGGLTRNGLLIFPAVDPVFTPGDTLHLFFEIYGLRKDADGQTNYQVENILARRRGRRFLPGFLFPARERISIVNEYTGRSEDDFVVQGINLATLSPGRYRLQIKVRDALSGMAVEKRLDIVIKK